MSRGNLSVIMRPKSERWRTLTDIAGQWVTVAEAARTLDVSQSTVQRWAETGRIPIRRDVRPHVVDVADSAGQTPDTSDPVAGQVESLEAEIARLRQRIEELRAERDYLRALSATLASSQQRLLEAPPRRKWRWPWQRRGE